MLLKDDDQALEPRVKRTRQLLLVAMKGLLHEQDLQSITVAEITQAAEVNRATFYAHFADKYALFDYLVRQSFQDALRQRLSDLEGFCLDDLQALVLAVFEYMGQMDIHCLPGDMQIRQLAAQQI